ncbi:uncharacterized protein LOC111861290 isoform X2 [Cryptotermes secundus]|nr:uncharacterized protein LOC111861290 isoform X2 [Cryptotermes secundus]
MYDALIGRSSPQATEHSMEEARIGVVTSGVSRPLSISSIASSSSSSSGTSSCSGAGGRRLGAAPKSSAYLASIESLEDDSDDPENGGGGGGGGGAKQRLHHQKPIGSRAERLKGGSGGSQGSGDSGVCSPCSYISSPCPPPGRPRYCDPHLNYMDRVVMEIVETEGVYVRDLQQVIEGYLDIWRAAPSCPLSNKQLADLFNNIEDIYKFNSGFLSELEKCGLDPVLVAQSFVRNNMGFSIYTQYCTNYPRTVSVLTELMRQEATVRLFRERQAALQHTLPLGSYLLKPVQRILKYHLLLQNIVKHYVYEAEGYKDIVDALSAMTGIAHHINNMKRRHEHAVRVQEIQSLLYGWEGEDLTTFGELCAEGAFRVYGAKALRHAFLFDRMLLITKKKEEGILGYKTHIMCSNLMLIESVPGEPLSFHVIPFDNPRLQYTLQARNLEQKREWTLQLKRVILENYNAVIPSHARQLVMELGQNRTDDEILADKATPKRQHSAPEYLEKRKQERDRRKSETGLRYRLRRSRKSDVGSSGGGTEQTSPLLQRRGRRASSSSRDHSESREESNRSTSPHAKMKDRFGSWRRKSEPGCYSAGVSNSKKSPKLAVAPVTDNQEVPSEVQNDLHEDIRSRERRVSLCIESSSADLCENICGGTADDSIDSEYDGKLGTHSAIMCEEGGDGRKESNEEQAKTLEEIVSQLLMQNHEFQKILKKQQRHVNLRHRLTNFVNGTSAGCGMQDETTDTENDDEDGVYETLSITASASVASRPGATSGQSYRAHRQAHMRALRNEQKSITSKSHHCESPLLESEYVTLMCHREDENIDRSQCLSNTKFNKKVDASMEAVDPLRGCSVSVYTSSATDVANKREWLHSHSAPIDEKSDREGRRCTFEWDKDRNGFGNYDNLQHIWESVRRQQEEIRCLAEREERGEGGDGEDILLNLRRTRSFSCQGGDDDTRQQQQCLPSSMSQASLDATNIPTLPAVWLKQQGEHLATPNKKSGSLPRSFQLGHDIHTPPHEGSSKGGSFRSRLLTRDGRLCPDRPFTIASDKPPEINFEDIERYIEESNTRHVRHRFPLNAGDTTEDDSMTDYTATPNTSLNELNVHPEYKIYRPSVSKASLKHVISSVSNKLAGMRMSSETLESNDGEVEHERLLQKERRASKLVYALARQYSKTLKQRIRNIMGEDSTEEYYDVVQHQTPSPVQTCAPVLPIYKQGSSSLGARIAHCSSEYADPRQLYPNIPPPPEAMRKTSDMRPDSVLSVSSHFTASSSEGEKTSGLGGSLDTTHPSSVSTSTIAPCNSSHESVQGRADDVNLSDGSADSYYERSFEAIESFLENEMFRDSAVFSDHEELTDSSQTYKDCNIFCGNDDSVPPLRSTKNYKIPPPVPVKPDVLKNKPTSHMPGSKPGIFEKVKSLEENCRYQKEGNLVRSLEGISKSILDRRRELELWKANGNSLSRDDECDTSSQHSTASTVIEVSPCKESKDFSEESEESGTPRGWVKHVIGKLQGSPTDGLQQRDQC